MRIRYIFWNIQKKNLAQEFAEAILENRIGAAVAAEAGNLDIPYLLELLAAKGKEYTHRKISPKGKGLALLAEKGLDISVYREEKQYIVYKVREDKRKYLLFAAHLSSAMYLSESARSQRAGDLSRIFMKIEHECNKEAPKQAEETYSAVVVGDFNLHPFSDGIIGMHGFHAILDENHAKKREKRLLGKAVPFYYNPMWNVMGKRSGPLGTYYCDFDQNDHSFYWYTFDQIFLRAELIDSFVWEELKIIDRIGQRELLNQKKPDRRRYSDHLPICFEIGQEPEKG